VFQKITVFLLAALLPLALFACQTARPSPAQGGAGAGSPAPQPTREPVEYALYRDYLASDDWAWEWSPEGGMGDAYAKADAGRYELTGQKIFDFDGDGVLDLWFAAQGKKYPAAKVSGFCTAADGKVEALLRGYVCGGSLGGETVAARYDTERKEHVLLLAGGWGGFGGHGSSGTYYAMKNGTLTEIGNDWAVEYAEDTEGENSWHINGQEVSGQEFALWRGRYKDPTDKNYILA